MKSVQKQLLQAILTSLSDLPVVALNSHLIEKIEECESVLANYDFKASQRLDAFRIYLGGIKLSLSGDPAASLPDAALRGLQSKLSEFIKTTL